MKKNGFTLIELLVAMTIISVLLGISLVSYQGARKTARDGKRKADIEEIRSALEMCRSDTDAYPGSITFGESLTCGGETYMDVIPSDPINEDPYLYSYNRTDVSSYTLCAGQLETTGLEYCQTNP